MLVKEMKEIIEMEIEELLDEGYMVGVRFEDLERKAGDTITDKSRHNNDREDERDFPEYGTDEYFGMAEFDGVSAYEAEFFDDYISGLVTDGEDATKAFLASHAYIIYSYDVSNTDDDLDYGEIVLVEPKVHKVLF